MNQKRMRSYLIGYTRGPRSNTDVITGSVVIRSAHFPTLTEIVDAIYERYRQFIIVTSVCRVPDGWVNKEADFTLGEIKVPT